MRRQRGVDEQRIRKATRRLTHRGPDGEGFWISDDRQVGIGHRRLSIVGIENGAQPIANETGDIRLVVNGEFYGFEKIRNQLERQGHRFTTESDSEIALHLYEDHGLNFVSHLRGEFAFILWDGRRRKLIAARDRFGIKPLLYSVDQEDVLIASEAKALFAAGVPPKWDVESFYHAASMQYVLPDRTLFRSVLQIPPGCLLLVDDQGSQIERYWDIPRGISDHTLPPADEQELIDRCRVHVVDAVAVRMRADVPVCCQLSGGLDSSAVLGIATEHSSDPLDAYSITFSTAAYDESNFAAEVADRSQAKMHAIHVTPSDILKTLPAAVRMSEGLCINGHLSAKYLLHERMAADGYRVVLTGEGADEAFAGYGHLRLDYWKQTGRTDLIDRLVSTENTSIGMMLAHGASLDLGVVRQRLGHVPAWMAAKATLGARTHQLLNPDSRAACEKLNPYEDLIAAVLGTKPPAGDAIDQSTRLWTRSAMANYILTTLGDGTEMPHAIEGRVPFLDHHLWEFLRDVPLELKIRGETEKYILREAVREYVPERIAQRPKHPFDAPPVSLSSDAISRDIINDMLHSDSFRNQPFFDVHLTHKMFCDLRTADATTCLTWDPVLMTVLSTIAMQEFLEGEAA